MSDTNHHFHLHLVSDSTGETLLATSRAVVARYQNAQAIEHIYPMVRDKKSLETVIKNIDGKPGIVLYTIADKLLGNNLHSACSKMGVPNVSILEPIFSIFQKYLGMATSHKPGAQHELNSDYFKRMEALNFTLMHDDGLLPDNIDEAEVVLLGISRTSKTPTSIYLANRGVKTVNLPLVPNVKIPQQLYEAKKPLIVALIASTDRIYQVRENRLLGSGEISSTLNYVDRAHIANEIVYTRKLVSENKWPLIDVTTKSIEETAANIIALLNDHKQRIDHIDEDSLS